MNKLFSVLSLSVFCGIAIAQTNTDNRTLFTIGNDKVPVSDFEYVYTKNNVNNQADFSEKSLRDYLNLYENFRLKVKEADAMQLDTISSLKAELEGYRKQLAKSYLTDREITDKLINEAYERSKTEINASHILVRCNEDANPADTLAAFKKITALKKRLDRGESFEKVAKENSEDPSAKTNEGNIGWFTVFGTIYPFESAAYSLKPGETSPFPVHTEFGYHLVKVNALRPARGQIHVAHLLLRFPENATQAQKDSVKKKIDEVYNLITSGKLPFEEAVATYSEDKATRVKNGELQWFGSGTSIRMVPEFEDAAFSLQKNGEITKPVMTQFGWHIIKRLEKNEIPSFDEAKATIKKRVERDSRSQVAKTVLIDRIKKENGFQQFADAKKKFDAAVDSNLFKGNWRPDSAVQAVKSTLFVLAGKNYTTIDFADYIEKTSKRRSDKTLDALVNEYYDGFVNSKCLEYEESTLETKKPEFKNLMQEYKDGILLFELMDRMVWTKAVKDTAGLEEYRKNNAQKYMWGERALAEIFNCNDKAICDKAYKMATKKSAEEITKKLNKPDANPHVSTLEGKYEKGAYDVVDKTNWTPGLSPMAKLNDSSYRFVLIKEIVKPEPKNLKEAKGYIVSDYQEYLEKTWLAQLRSKYPIVLDESVFKSLIKK